ncbi:hypothetical protein M758_1G173600 [Ceratodon purpureus]|nr:hypothetical protein M758_1G173600 [Ceratodon purpureus]
MAMAATMDATGQHVGYPWVLPGAKRKWSGQGVGQSKQRYTNMNRVVVESQGQGLGLGKRRLDGVQKESHVKRRKFYAKRRVPRSVPRAPYNDSSFLMRVKRLGGLESSVVSLTPTSFMSSPKDSSYKLDTYEDFVDHEDYGYGSMTGLIRLRRGEDGDQSSGCSTVENNSGDENVCVEHPSVLSSADSAEQMEQRLDRGVSRFEMTHPAPHEFAELRVARQDSHIQYMENENLVLKDRLSLMQQELNELRRRLQEGQNCIDFDESDESDD